MKCTYCKYEFDNLPVHESQCFLNPKNLKKFAVFITKFIVRQKFFQKIHYSPARSTLSGFSNRNKIEHIEAFRRRVFSDLEIEDVIDFCLSVAVLCGATTIEDLPPYVRFVYDARQFCTEKEFDDKMNKLTSLEALLLERMKSDELQNQLWDTVQHRTHAEPGEVRRRFWNKA